MAVTNPIDIAFKTIGALLSADEFNQLIEALTNRGNRDIDTQNLNVREELTVVGKVDTKVLQATVSTSLNGENILNNKTSINGQMFVNANSEFYLPIRTKGDFKFYTNQTAGTTTINEGNAGANLGVGIDSNGVLVNNGNIIVEKGYLKVNPTQNLPNNINDLNSYILRVGKDKTTIRNTVEISNGILKVERYGNADTYVLDVLGAVRFDNGALIVNDNIVEIDKPTTIKKAVTIEKTLDTYGFTQVHANLNVLERAENVGGNVTIQNKLTSRLAEITEDLKLHQALLTVNSLLSKTGIEVTAGGLTVNAGNTAINDTLTVAEGKTATFNGGIVVNGSSTTLNSPLNVANNVNSTFGGNITVAKNSQFETTTFNDVAEFNIPGTTTKFAYTGKDTNTSRGTLTIDGDLVLTGWLKLNTDNSIAQTPITGPGQQYMNSWISSIVQSYVGNIQDLRDAITFLGNSADWLYPTTRGDKKATVKLLEYLFGTGTTVPPDNYQLSMITQSKQSLATNQTYTNVNSALKALADGLKWIKSNALFSAGEGSGTVIEFNTDNTNKLPDTWSFNGVSYTPATFTDFVAAIDAKITNMSSGNNPP